MEKTKNPVIKEVSLSSQALQPAYHEAELLISQAINKKVPVETMEKLLAMRREIRAERAKEEFDIALAKFQSECPAIKKTKIVYEKDGVKVRYKYAPLDSIIEQVKGVLATNGFSYTTNTIQTDTMFGVVCKATHRAGHSQETTFSIPIGSESYMSEVQKYGARLTFAKRYAFCNAFGILTTDEDNDAVETSPATAQPAKQIPAFYSASDAQIKYIRNLLIQKGRTEAQILSHFKIDNLNKLSRQQATKMIDWMITLPEAPKPAVVAPAPVIEPEQTDIVDPDEAEEGIEEMKKEEATA
jgi:hypothetical protein